MVQPALRPRREALHDTIQHRIERYIIETGSKPGDALPSQQELARALGISMPSLREAMKSLEALGVVEVRQGSGTFVGRFSFDAFVDGLAFRIRLEASEHRRTVTEFLDIRMILERAYVQQVAVETNDAHVAELYALVEEMNQVAAEGRQFRDEDRRFHVLLYRPVENAMLEMLVGAFWELSLMARNEFDVAPVSPATTAAEHLEIVDALAARDPERAARAMTVHFDGILSRIKED
ncbi:MAG: FadR family transcriptional regulator [Thermomicrobiales bacterium]|nr:FadR family transcriptional regulator [Thermomicrobiales bacterium]